MVRAALATYLMIHSVIGPALCCCALSSVPKAEPDRTASRHVAKCPCCRSDDETQPYPRQPSAPSQPAPGKPCPCRQHATDAVITLADAFQADESVSLQRTCSAGLAT